MTEIPEAFAAHLAAPVTTLCHCWILTLANGEKRGFTDHDTALDVDGVACAPDTGFDGSEATSRLGLASDSMEIDGALSSPLLDEREIEAGMLDDARVEAHLVNWRDPTQHLLLKVSVVGRITRADGRFVAELKTIAESLDRPAGRLVRRSCDAELGDHRCGVDLEQESLAAEGTVTAVDGTGIVSLSGVETFAACWFEHGTAVWTSGVRAGRVDRIVQHDVVGATARLCFMSAVTGVAPGDGVALRAGCDKRFATCSGKFSNTLNFRGFPHMPGNDAAYAYAKEGAVFDGRPIVP